jgi:hypothetical protein
LLFEISINNRMVIGNCPLLVVAQTNTEGELLDHP